jgi:competence protein ComEC
MLESFLALNQHFLIEPYSSILNGMIWGVPLKTSKSLYTAFNHTGLLHMVVLSGTNVNFILSYTYTLTSVFSKKVSILISLLILFIFISLVPLEAPMTRALIMGVLTSVSFLFGRQIITLYSLLLAFILMIVIDPKSISTVSFQLSFAATIGIILSSKLNGIFDNKFFQFIFSNIKITLAAELFTLPIIMYHFRQVSLIAPISNILVAWTVEPILIFGFIGDILGIIWQPLGYIPLVLCQGILMYFMSVVYFLEKIPFGFIDLN